MASLASVSFNRLTDFDLSDKFTHFIEPSKRNEDRGVEGDFLDGISEQQARDAGYTPIADGAEIPSPDQYVGFKRMGDDQIRYTYVDSNGEEVKASVFKHNSPVRFEKIEFILNAQDAGYEVITDPADLPDSSLYTDLYSESDDFILGTNAKAMGFEYTDENGNVKKFVVHRDIGNTAFFTVAKAWENADHTTVMRRQGYELFDSVDELPAYSQYTEFGDPSYSTSDDGKAITFEYLNEDGKEMRGYVHKDVDAESFEKVSDYREILKQTDGFLAHRNAQIQDDARDGTNAVEVRAVREPWNPPHSDRVSVEDVGRELGKTPDGKQIHGVVVTEYSDDTQTTVINRYLVLEAVAPEAYDDAVRLMEGGE